MKSLKESLLSRKMTSTDIESAMIDNIKNFIKENYKKTGKYLQDIDIKDSEIEIIKESDKYIVNYKGSIHLDHNATSINGGLFEWNKIDGSFSITSCKNITSLVGSPKRVDGNFKVQDIPIKNLEGCPEKIGKQWNLYIWELNELESLKGIPSNINSHIDIMRCPKLKTLEGLPKKTDYDISIYRCSGLTSLKGIPKIVKSLELSDLDIKTIDYTPEIINMEFTINNCPNLEEIKMLPKTIVFYFGILNCPKLSEEQKALYKKKFNMM